MTIESEAGLLRYTVNRRASVRRRIESGFALTFYRHDLLRFPGDMQPGEASPVIKNEDTSVSRWT
jgi:hypothetical protein